MTRDPMFALGFKPLSSVALAPLLIFCLSEVGET